MEENLDKPVSLEQICRYTGLGKIHPSKSLYQRKRDHPLPLSGNPSYQ